MNQKYSYNTIIIGAGAAGLSAAWLSAKLGAKTLLIEENHPGGECLYHGCIPSKSLISYIKKNKKPEFKQALAYIKDKITAIEPHDSFVRYNKLGVDTVAGHAIVSDRKTVTVGNKEFTSKKIIIATGSSPNIPQIPGLENSSYLTYKTIWDLKKLPASIVIIGGGPAGCELAQALHKLGSHVTILEQGLNLLPLEDVETSTLLENKFLQEGINVITNCIIESVRQKRNKIEFLIKDKRNETHRQVIQASEILVLTGKKATLPTMPAAIHLTSNGYIKTDEYLQTTIPGIYAIGDVNGKMQLTNAASAQAVIAVTNALLRPLRNRFVANQIPYAVFTNPEIARVGITFKEIKKQNIPCKEYYFPFTGLNRAIVEESDKGFIRVVTNPKEKILGVTIVGTHAAEVMGEYVLAMKHGIPLTKMMFPSHIYPTMSEASVYVSGLASSNSIASRFLSLLSKWQQFNLYF